MPAFEFFIPNVASLRNLIVPALILAFIGAVQGITMAQALAARRRERIDANRELVGLGAANVVAAGTHWFARLPLAVLAANIVLAAASLIDIKTLRQAWSYDRADALALIGTGLSVVFLRLEPGIVIGIGLSRAILLLRASSPHIAVVGRIPGSEHFRNIERHDVETAPGALFLRIDENLFFGNLDAIDARLTAELEKAPDTRDVVLIMSTANNAFESLSKR